MITQNRELSRYIDQELRTLPVAAAMRIYKGALIGIQPGTGFARNLVAGDRFAGIAYEEIDNRDGSAGGEQFIRAYTQGDFVLPVIDALQECCGDPVYATDNESLCLYREGAPINSYAGILIARTGANQGIVRILPFTWYPRAH